ncbi:UDP-N-acetyl glucosamine 2-epimerase [Candidatus Protofrankia californiensis]|uniref:UDP-N-acetyl glucosamine 2-epimerase n=1 Tax=Candidatus Protofrankia californiensis TaxID=1839754 RepID=UPI0019D1115D|nr:UDP-N-acetylglucosamine 2-epimerase [Candidatus Protofrankia californiensis]
MVSQIAALHLAPTTGAVTNLRAAGVPDNRIVLTGNTVVDALQAARAATCGGAVPPQGGSHSGGAPRVLVTAHRRESWGEPIAQVGRAVARLADRHPDWEFVVACHMNPAVRATLDAVIPRRDNVTLGGPVGYAAFVRMLADAAVVLTDSGGIQEEAPVLGVPVLVTREVTERPEAVACGAAQLVGTDPQTIVAAVEALLGGGSAHRPAVPHSPFGDGRAGERSAAACAWLLGLGSRPHDMPAPAALPHQNVPATGLLTVPRQSAGDPADAFRTATGPTPS